MSDTPNLGLPLMAAAQAQKHVTHNEALLAIDSLLHCAILDKDLAAPPASPAEGSRYIVAAGATGAWLGKTGRIATWRGDAWDYLAPKVGILAFVIDEALLYIFTEAAWVSLTSALASVQNLGLLGIGTSADAANPVSAKINKALWTARTAGEGGSGDLRYVLNKEGAANVLSLLFQTGYSGRCEIGLIGGDNAVVKVSPDGSSWRTALALDAASGGADFLSASTSLTSASTCDIGAAPTRKVSVTGTTTIASLGSGANKERLVTFAGALTLTHNPASLSLPGNANLVTAAGDTGYLTSDGSGNWTMRHYGRAALNPPNQNLGTTAAAQFASLGLGTPATTQLHLRGANEATTVPSFTGTAPDPLGAAAYLQDTGGAPSSGGALLFGASQGVYAAIKGALASGTGPSGDLNFATRINTAGAALTRRMSITYNGQVVPGSSGAALGSSSLPWALTATTGAFSGPVQVGSYTAATLPSASPAGRLANATNGRAVTSGGTVQAPGAGTGTLVTSDGTNWLVAGTNIVVSA